MEIYYEVNGKRGNRIKMYDNYAELIVTYKGKDIAYKIDIADIVIVIQHQWGFHQQGYNCVRTGDRGPNLEGTLLNVYNGRFEHINGDEYDCRRANLRVL